MPSNPQTPAWDLDGPYGLERWSGPSGRFDQVFLTGEQVSLDPGDGELHLLRPRASNCAHPGPWPFAFGFCPNCGTPLQSPPHARATEAWSSPGSAASGQPAPASVGTPDPAQRTELPMPGPSRLDFFVAGTPPNLLAFDQTTSRLHAWVEGPSNPFDGGRWREVATLPLLASLPRWSWAVAASAGGFALPGDDGPLWIPLSPRFTTPVVPSPTLGIQRGLGGAAFLDGMALVPVLVDGMLALAAWVPRDGVWRRVTALGGDAAVVPQVFAAPSHSAKEAFWVGEYGQLHARASRDGVTCEYRAWRDGWQPMRGVRPVLSPDGVFHQLGRLDGQQAFEALVPPGATPQRRAFDRYVTSCGSATFIGMRRHREPWEPKRMEYRSEADAFLVPLLAFDRDRFLVASCSPRNALRGFIETEGDPAGTIECRIMFAGASLLLTDLRATIRAGSAWEIVVAVYGRSLLAYDLRGNRCFRWPLVSEPGNA